MKQVLCAMNRVDSVSHNHKIAIIGAGPMGLTCAYYLLQKGHKVHVFEADDRVGGMSAVFDFSGLEIERYYHFICGPDQHTFSLLKSLDISASLSWTETKMGYFYHGHLYPWGNPLALLRFPGLDMLSKLRYGMHALYTIRIKDWRGLDKQEASQWITRLVGKKGYEILWEPLFSRKFFEHVQNLSAAWIGTRMQRIGKSRKNMFREQLGYLEGGTKTLVDALVRKIDEMGGRITLDSPVQKIEISNDRVTGVITTQGGYQVDTVISTIPLPYLSKIALELPSMYRQKVDAIQNIGIVCVVFKLQKAVTENFWLNINDPRIEIPGIIEYSNLRPLKNKIVYAPYYMPQSHENWDRPDVFFIGQVKSYLSMINPEFQDNWVLDARVFRYEYAQPICPPCFFDALPPYFTGVRGLWAADTSHSYPEDRSINESIRIAGEICAEII